MGVLISKRKRGEQSQPRHARSQAEGSEDEEDKEDEQEQNADNEVVDESEDEKESEDDDQDGGEVDEDDDDEKDEDEDEKDEDEDEKDEDDDEKDEDENEDEADEEEKESNEQEEDKEDDWYKVEDDAEVPFEDLTSQLLKGFIRIQVPSQARIVRIFTSSTFTDTSNERNTLMVKVYPKLKEYCQSVGYDFQVVDMRWGVRDEATTDHMTSELCMRELKLCQEVSTGPSFVTFLSHKYGYRPFPPKIAATEFEALLNVVPDQEDKDLLTKWFIKDENILPTTYVLQPITDLLPNYGNRDVSKEERSAASNEWWTAFERMQVVLRNAADKAFEKAPTVRWKYYMSVTEDEIQRGLISTKNPKIHTHWFQRNITDLRENVGDKLARNFIDKLGPKLDDEAVNFTEELKTGKITSVLPNENISIYDVKWLPEHGINPTLSEEHKKYLDNLCDDFYKVLKKMINDGIQERKAADIEDKLIKEICQHASICKEKSRIFHGRDEEIKQILEYVRKDVEDDEFVSPLVVYGESGCGKTSVIAKAASLAKDEFPDRIQVTRFLGTTAESSSISKLLYSICCQIQRATNLLIDTSVPQTFKEMHALFESIIEQVSEKEINKCILFLDSIDQLAPDDGAYLMKWLPKKLPQCFRIVISALPDQQYRIVDSLKGVVPEDCFVKIGGLPEDTASNILKFWLKDIQKTLTRSQTWIVINAFKQCPLPLFLRLSFDQATKWKSYQNIEPASLQNNVKESINKLFSDLERMHGKTLVSHALGLITASKNGLSDAELEDILSIDDDVLNDVYQYWVPPVRRIPSLLWIRVRNDLGSYIVYRGASNVLVNNWYHRQFIETARERYLSESEKEKFHKLIAEYFLGLWSNGVKKPFINKSNENGEEERLVAAQPNRFKNSSKEDDMYNYRKLSELPHHLLQIKNLQHLKDNVLFSFDFLLTKLQAFGHKYILEDFQEAAKTYPKDDDIKLLYNIMKACGRTLRIDPYQFGTQLFGRLSDRELSEDFKKLLQQASSLNVPCFIPNKLCFESPGESLKHSFAGHTGTVENASFSRDGTTLLSVGSDSTIKIWDMESGFEIRSSQLEQSPTNVFTYNNDTCAVIVGYATVTALNIQTDEIYYEEYHNSSYGPSSHMSPDRKYLVTVNQSEIIVFKTADKSLEICKKFEEDSKEDTSGFYDVARCNNDLFIYTRGDSKQFYIRKFNDLDKKKKAKSPHPFMTLSFTVDGSQIVAITSPDPVTEPYKRVFLYFFDAETGNMLKKMEGKDSHTVLMCNDACVCQTKNGMELIWATLMQINFWNLDTGQERTALKQGYQGRQFKSAFSNDGESLVVVPMDSNNSPIQVYDMNELDYVVVDDLYAQRSLIQKTKDYVGTGDREMYLSRGDPNLCISITPVDPILKIWDLQKRVQTKECKIEDLYPTSLMTIDDHRALIWETNKQVIYLVDFVKEEIVYEVKFKKKVDTVPSLYTNCWVFIQAKDELIIFSETSKDFKILDLKTGKTSGEIKTGWSTKGQHMLASKDGSIVLSKAVDPNNHSKIFPLCVFDTIKREKIGEFKRELAFDLQPDTTPLSEDGKYLVTPNEDRSEIEVWNVQTLKLIRSFKLTGNEEDYMYLRSVTVSSTAGIILVVGHGTLHANNNIQVKLLFAYNLETFKQILQIPTYGAPYVYQYSNDYKFMMTDCRPENESVKCLDLYDISKVKSDGIIKKIASLKPETDTRFAYLSQDGKTVCVGLAGVEGITFFSPCSGVCVLREGRSLHRAIKGKPFVEKDGEPSAKEEKFVNAENRIDEQSNSEIDDKDEEEIEQEEEEDEGIEEGSEDKEEDEDEEVDDDKKRDEEDDDNNSSDNSSDNEEQEEDEQNEEEKEEDEESKNEEDDWCKVHEDMEVPFEDLTVHLLKGFMRIKVPSQARIVRIFTSSTFTDTSNERNTLMVKVYPKLKEYCQSVGYDFQVVDMRWGVRDEATTDHMTSELCMRELKLCQEVSTGPSFVTFLSHKYGYRPFPPKIAATEFEALLSVVPDQEDKDLLTKWFIKDENILPTTYVLQPITDLLPNYGNRSVSKEERSTSSNKWWTAFERMQVILRNAADKAFENAPDVRWKYYMSVTEDEIQRGIISTKNPEIHTHWFQRNITDLRENVDDKMARNFIDKLGPKLDDEAVNFTEELKKGKITSVLRKENISTYDVKWLPEHGINPTLSEEHKKYLDNLCDEFYKVLKKMIDDGIQERKAADIEDKLIKEICQHATMCKEKSRIFHGRDEEINYIMQYLQEEVDYYISPLVVYGESGCGKTSVIAKAASLAKDKFPDRIQVTRFLGTTAESSTIFKLLHSIFCQIQRATNVLVDTSVPQTFKELYALFVSIIEKVTVNDCGPCILFLDSIDQLGPDDGAYLMRWLPKKLPNSFRIVISALPDKKYGIVDILQGVVPDDCFVKIGELPQNTANKILKFWLKDNQKILTSSQTSIVINAFNQCPLPLFLRLSFDQAMKWKINKLFSDLERMHGKTLVSHALGLITASKNGLSDVELEDILSIDDEVLNDVYQYWVPPVRRIPSLLWIRVRNDLGSYIVYRGANNVLVNTWYHRQFIETARERYLSESEKEKFHKLIAEYYLGLWSNGVKKPFINKSNESGEEDRLVAAQPNRFKNSNKEDDMYNYRKLSELPHHLLQIKDLQHLKADVLFSFDFLLTKLQAFGHKYVLEDFQEVAKIYPKDDDIKLLYNIMKACGRTLRIDPYQFGTQLFGRLSDRELSEDFKKLLQQASSFDVPYFIPNKCCFESPGDSLKHSFAGHEGMVENVSLSLDGTKLLSIGVDGIMKIWDMENGFEIRSSAVEQSPQQVFTYNNDKCIILVAYNTVTALDIQTDEVYYEEYHDASYGPSSHMSPDRKFLVIINGVEVIAFKTDDKNLEVYKKFEEGSEQKNNFYDVARCNDESFIYTRGDNSQFFIRKFNNLDEKKVAKSPHPFMMLTFNVDGSQIIAITTPDPDTEPYKRVFLYFFDAETGNMLKKMEGKDSHTVFMCNDACVCQTNNGMELIWATLMQVNFWNLDTGQERTTLKQGYQGRQYKSAFSQDGESLVVVPMDTNNTPIQVYDMNELDYVVVDDSVADRTLIEKTKAYGGEGDRDMYLSQGDPNICISTTLADPILKIWDIQKKTQVNECNLKDVYPSSVMVIDDHRALMWEYNKHTIYLVDFVKAEIVHEVKFDEKVDFYPSPFSNCWVYIQAKDELVICNDTTPDFNILDLKTGKISGKIKTGWSREGRHMLASKDGSIILSKALDPTDRNKNFPLCVFDTIQRKKIGELNRELVFDPLPDTYAFSEDGKYLITHNEDRSEVEVWNVQTCKMMKSFRLSDNTEDSLYLKSVTVSSTAGFILVAGEGALHTNVNTQIKMLFAYDLETFKQILQIPTYGIPSKFQYSNDYKFMMTDANSGNESVKCIDLYDISKVKCDRIITKIASLKPETDTRFAYLSQDGKTVCVGLANFDGIIFFSPGS